MDYMEKFEFWKKNCLDESIRMQLAEMENDKEQIENAFYKDMEFGTAGIRAIVGAGSNCLNIYTIAKISRGIANYMNNMGYRSVSICRDSRHYSDEFTFIAARVFAESGILVNITWDIMPTPFLSYMVRNCPSDMGIMITASHNPPNYNGYKVYNRHGYQLTDAAALEIAEYISKVDPFSINYYSLEHYVKLGKIKYIDPSLIENYLNDVSALGFNPIEDIKIVYTPLNGTGYKLIPEILKRRGAKDLLIVKEQGMPDGSFPTCPSPNPEKREALKLGIDLATKNKYDIVLATDPDADRIAVAVRNNKTFELLTGNEIGCLLTEYILESAKEQGTLPENPLIIKSIVTTPLASRIVESYGGECINVLTGFKYIGEKITKLDKNGEGKRFMLGLEESYGYLRGTHVRDKDAVVIAMLISEMASTYMKKGISLIDKLEELYAKFGTYEHKVVSYEYQGAVGSKKMRQLLDEFRSNTPQTLAGRNIVIKVDYLNDETGLPRTDMISVRTEDGCILIVRPSGTEPLIKFYISASKTREENAVSISDILNEIEAIFKA